MVEAEMKHSLPPERQMEPRSRLDKKWVVRENKSDTSGWDGISMCNRWCSTVFKHRFTNDDNREDGKSSKGRQRINKLFPFCLFHGEVSCSWNDSRVSLIVACPLLLAYFQVLCSCSNSEAASWEFRYFGRWCWVGSGGRDLSGTPTLRYSCFGARAVKLPACLVALQSFIGWHPCQTKTGQVLVAAQQISPLCPLPNVLCSPSKAEGSRIFG